MAPPWWLAFIFAAAFGLLAFGMRWLTIGGAISTFVMGLLVYWLGGGRAIVPLLAFFLSSSVLSKLGRDRKALSDRFVKKQGPRDAAQVWANGGAAVGIVLLHTYLRHAWPLYKLAAIQILYLSALTAVNADTWATEIGCWVGQTPRSLRDFKPVPPGVSGGVTVAGTLGALGGALFIPLVVVQLWPLNPAEFLVAAWAGFLGSGIDSILGASLQVQYRDPATGALTERTVVEGRPAVRVHGLPWINNDMVNFLASLGAVLCAWLLMRSAAVIFF